MKPGAFDEFVKSQSHNDIRHESTTVTTETPKQSGGAFDQFVQTQSQAQPTVQEPPSTLRSAYAPEDIIKAGLSTCKDGEPSCAYFASGALRKTGVNVQVTPGAKALIDAVRKGGGFEVPKAQAQVGDLVFYRGPDFGVAKFNEKGETVGYHVGYYAGNGRVIDSSNGKVREFNKIKGGARFMRPSRGGNVPGMGYGAQNEGPNVPMPPNQQRPLQQIPHLDLFATDPNSIRNVGQPKNIGYGQQNEGPQGMEAVKETIKQVANSPEYRSSVGLAKVQKLRDRKEALETEIKGLGYGTDPKVYESKRKELAVIYSELRKSEKPGVEQPGVSYGSQDVKPKNESHWERQGRLVREYNGLSEQINQGQNQILQAQGLIKNGADRVNRLIDLINQGQTQHIPEYKAMIERVKGISENLSEFIGTHNESVNRLNEVATAVNEYKQGQARLASTASQGSLNRFMQFIYDAGKFATDMGDMIVGSAAISAANDSSQLTDANYDLASKGYAGMVGAAKFVSQAPKNFIRVNADKISNAFGLGDIDPEIYKTDRGTQISGAFGEFAPYLIPGINAVLGTASATLLTEEARKSPENAFQQVVDSINPIKDTIIDSDTGIERPVRPEERGIRALSALMLATAAASTKVKLSEVFLRDRMMKTYNLPAADADWAIGQARDYFKRSSGGGAKGDLFYFLETLKGTNIAKMAEFIGKGVEAQNKANMIDLLRQRVIPDKSKAEGVYNEAMVEKPIPLTPDVRQASGAPALGSPTYVPNSTTKPVPFNGPDGTPSGYNIRVTNGAVEIINTDGGVQSFTFNPAEAATYQNALSQAQAYVAQNPAAVIPAEPKMPPATAPTSQPAQPPKGPSPMEVTLHHGTPKTFDGPPTEGTWYSTDIKHAEAFANKYGSTNGNAPRVISQNFKFDRVLDFSDVEVGSDVPAQRFADALGISVDEFISKLKPSELDIIESNEKYGGTRLFVALDHGGVARLAKELGFDAIKASENSVGGAQVPTFKVLSNKGLIPLVAPEEKQEPKPAQPSVKPVGTQPGGLRMVPPGDEPKKGEMVKIHVLRRYAKNWQPIDNAFEGMDYEDSLKNAGVQFAVGNVPGIGPAYALTLPNGQYVYLGRTDDPTFEGDDETTLSQGVNILLDSGMNKVYEALAQSVKEAKPVRHTGFKPGDKPEKGEKRDPRFVDEDTYADYIPNTGSSDWRSIEFADAGYALIYSHESNSYWRLPFYGLPDEMEAVWERAQKIIRAREYPREKAAPTEEIPIKSVDEGVKEDDIAWLQSKLAELPPVPKKLHANPTQATRQIDELLIRRGIEKAIEEGKTFVGRQIAYEIGKGKTSLPPASRDMINVFLFDDEKGVAAEVLLQERPWDRKEQEPKSEPKEPQPNNPTPPSSKRREVGVGDNFISNGISWQVTNITETYVALRNRNHPHSTVQAQREGADDRYDVTFLWPEPKPPTRKLSLIDGYFAAKDGRAGLMAIRVGDFFEFFGRDAEDAAAALNITLTSREHTGGERIAMSGVPFHSKEKYFDRLIDAGFAVYFIEDTDTFKPVRYARFRPVPPKDEPKAEPTAPATMAGLGEMSDDDIDALLDDAVAEETEAIVEATTGKTPNEILDEVVKEGTERIDNLTPEELEGVPLPEPKQPKTPKPRTSKKQQREDELKAKHQSWVGKFDRSYGGGVDQIIEVRQDPNYKDFYRPEWVVKDVKTGIVRTHATAITKVYDTIEEAQGARAPSAIDILVNGGRDAKIPKAEDTKPSASDVLGIEDPDDDFGALGDILGLRQEIPAYDDSNGEPQPIGSNDPNPKRIELARTALDNLVSRHAGTVVGQALIANYVRGEAASLKGQLVTSLEDVAIIAQPLRDPRYEVFTWILTKGDTVVHAEAFSSRLPSSTDIFDTRSVSEVKAKLLKLAKDSDADGVYMLHNHPSGSPTPSKPDVQTTFRIWQDLQGTDLKFRGHVIINSNEYGVIDESGDTRVIKKEFHKQDPTLHSKEQLNAQEHGYLIGLKLSSLDDIAVTAKAVEKSDQVTLVSVTHQNRVGSVATFPLAVLIDAAQKRQASRMAAWLSKYAKLSGGGRVYLVLSGDQAKKIKGNYAIESIRLALERNILDDVIIGGDAVRSNAIGYRSATYHLGRDELASKGARRVRQEPTPFFDEATYAKAKPIMDRLFTKYEATGKTLPEFVAVLIKTFSPEAKPIIRQFLIDKRAEIQAYNNQGPQNADNPTRPGELGGNQQTQTGASEPIEQSGVRGDGGSSTSVQGDGVDTVPPVGADEPGGESTLEEPGGPRGSSPRGTAKNYRIGNNEGIGEASIGQKKKDLIAALEVIKKLEETGKPPTKAQQEVVAKFPGWGWTGNMLSFERNNDKTWQSPDPEFRDAVWKLITREEFAAASTAVLNSHYTSIPVVDAHWKLASRLGFKGGKAMEPSAGVGYFLGRSPKDIDWTAVELDSLSAKILKVLYPESNVFHAGFEQIKARQNNSLFISNVPFGRIQIADYAFEKESGEYGKALVKSIHNYFIAKGLDHLHEGGIEIVTTSAFSLNGRSKDSRQFREYMLEKADFIGAIRLPDTAFKQVADTSVTTDILVFRKRNEGDPVAGEQFLDVVQVTTDDGDVAYVNEYFVKNPHMVLGTHSMRGKMQQGLSYTVKPHTDKSLEEQLNKAIAKFPQHILGETKITNNIGYNSGGVRPPKDVRVWNVFEQDGEFYVKISQFESEPLTYMKKALTPDQKTQIKLYLKVRNTARELVQLNRSTEEDSLLEPAQKALRAAYDAYLKKFGTFVDTKNKPLLKKDAEWAMVFGLEKLERIVTGYNKKDQEITKEVYKGLSDIFTKRVASFGGRIEKAVDASSALVASLDNLGYVSLEEMSRVSGIAEKQLLDDLKGQLFFDPEKKAWVMRDEYGSGNVRKKLAQARAAFEADPELEHNVKFLESVQPAPMATKSIKVNLGTPWVPEKYIEDFLTDIGASNVSVSYNKILRRWDVDGNFPFELDVVFTDKDNERVQYTYPYKNVVDAALANASVVATAPTGIDDRGRPVQKPHEELTALANAAVEQLRTQWDATWRSDEEIAKHLTDLYNEIVNVVQRRVYDGSFLSLPGISTLGANGEKIGMRKHQKDATWRAVVQDFSLAAHGVGAGKTWEIIATAKELKRTGKRQKPVIIAKNETETQIFDAINMLYPGSSVLFVEPKDMTADKRQQLMGRIATGEYDFIIMRHSDFKLIPVSDAVYTAALQRAMNEIYEAADSIGGIDLRDFDPYNDDPKAGVTQRDLYKLDEADRVTVKKLWRNLKNLAARHQRRNQKLASRQDVGLFFDDLGIDHILLDESHYYRNIAYQSVRGGLGSAGSEMGEDMRMKLDFVRDNGGGATFYTGTPVVNTIAELYAQFIYLAPEMLAEQQTKTFDEWVNQFGETRTTLERDVSGAFKEKARTSKYINQAQLVNNFWQIADVKMTEDLPEIKRPQMVDEDGNVTGRPITIESEPSLIDNSFMASLTVRAKRIKERKGPAGKGDDIMLSIANDANDGALDIRLVDDTQADDPNSKINKAVAKVAEIYNLPKVQELKGTQLLFLDRGAPKKTTPAPDNLYFKDVSFDDLAEKSKEIEDAGFTPTTIENDDGTYNVEPDLTPEFNLYRDIKEKLIAAGIPATEIAFAQDYNTRVEKQALYRKMNAGEIRIMLTSTLKGGVGVNVQERLFALHNLDCPWTPADYEQRLGRIVRQGNIWLDHGGVRVYNHIKVGTFDSFRWNVLARKIVPITQVMRGDVSKSEIEVEDMDEVAFYEQQAAQAAGRTDILDYMRLSRELDKLQTAKRGFDMRKKRTKRGIEQAEKDIPHLNRQIKQLRKQHDTFNDLLPDPLTYTRPGSSEVVTKPKEIGLDIINLLEKSTEGMYTGQIKSYVHLGNLGALKIYASVRNTAEKFSDPANFKATITLQTANYETLQIYADRELKDFFDKPENYAATIASRFKNEIQTPLKEARKLEESVATLEHQVSSLRKKLDEKWDQQAEFDEVFAKWKPLDETVGAEVKSKEGAGGWGTKLENDPMPPDYWIDLRERKVAARLRAANNAGAARDAVETSADRVTAMEDSDAFFTNPFKRKPSATPKAKPAAWNAADWQDRPELIDVLLRNIDPTARGPLALSASLYLREVGGYRALATEQVAHMLEEATKYFDKMPRMEALEFLDNVENGRQQKNPKLQKFADTMRAILDYKAQMVRDLGTGKLEECIENYFPHIWKQQGEYNSKIKSWLKENLGIESSPRSGLGRKPIEGSKSFLKRRSIATTKQGIDDFKLEPLSWNPVDILLMKLREMDKYILAVQMMERLKAEGLLIYVPIGGEMPIGYEVVKSTFFDVYSPGDVTVQFAYDEKMFNQLTDFLASIGGTYEYKNSIGPDVLGDANSATYEVRVRYGARIETLTHEIGHIIDYKFKLGKKLFARNHPQKEIIKKETEALAMLRVEGQQNVSKNYTNYILNQRERIANLIHAYVHARELVQKFAPTTLKILDQFLWDTPELKPLRMIKPSLLTGIMETTYTIFGKTYTGRFVAPSEVAQVFNNHLSPGLADNPVGAVRVGYNGFKQVNNILNMVQLGFDGFHGLVTSLNLVFSQVGLGLQQLSERDIKNGVANVILGSSVFGSVVPGIFRGKAIEKAYLEGSSKDPKMQAAIRHIVMAGGKVKPDAVYFNDFRRKLRVAIKEAFKDPKINPGGKLGRVGSLPYIAFLASVEFTSAWLMERLVPWLKIAAFEQLAANEMLRLAEQRPNYTRDDELATLARVWDSIDNRFGMMVYDNLFMDSIIKHSVQQGFRAFGWAYGTVREIGGAAVDVAGQAKSAAGGSGGRYGGGGGSVGRADDPKYNGPTVPSGATPREWYTLSMFIMTALIGGIITYLRTGEAPKNATDLIFPKNGDKNPDGTDSRLALPSYAGETYKWLTHPIRTLSGKKSPLISVFGELKENRTFYGVQVYDENDAFLAQTGQVLAYFGSQYAPIAFRKNNEFDESGLIDFWGMTFTPERFWGILKAPMSTSRSTAINKAADLMGKQVGERTRTKEQASQNNAKKQLQIFWYERMEAIKKGNTKEADKLRVQMEAIEKKYPGTADKAMKEIIVTDDETGLPRVRTPIERAIMRLGNNELLIVLKEADETEAPIIKYAIAKRLGKMQAEALKGNQIDKAFYEKARKALVENP